MRTVFVSGHLDLTEAEFAEHYIPRLKRAHEDGCRFVVGDARGADVMAQRFLGKLKASVVVYHMSDLPRNNPFQFPMVGGYHNDTMRDVAMTDASTEDLAWVRPGREHSGTAKNLLRRPISKAFVYPTCPLPRS
jgi:hypothetical protein